MCQKEEDRECRQEHLCFSIPQLCVSVLTSHAISPCGGNDGNQQFQLTSSLQITILRRRGAPPLSHLYLKGLGRCPLLWLQSGNISLFREHGNGFPQKKDNLCHQRNRRKKCAKTVPLNKSLLIRKISNTKRFLHLQEGGIKAGV